MRATTSRGALFALALVPVALASCGGSAASATDVSCDIRVDPDPARVGPIEIELRLLGPDGAPLSGASIEVEGNMSHAGMVPVFSTPVEGEPGVYDGAMELTMGGDWFLSIEAQLADGRRFAHVHDLPGVLRRDDP